MVHIAKKRDFGKGYFRDTIAKILCTKIFGLYSKDNNRLTDIEYTNNQLFDDNLKPSKDELNYICKNNGNDNFFDFGGRDDCHMAGNNILNYKMIKDGYKQSAKKYIEIITKNMDEFEGFFELSREIREKINDFIKTKYDMKKKNVCNNL